MILSQKIMNLKFQEKTQRFTESAIRLQYQETDSCTQLYFRNLRKRSEGANSGSSKKRNGTKN
jgi:hypothetical protein